MLVAPALASGTGERRTFVKTTACVLGSESQMLKGNITGWREETQASSFRGYWTLGDFSRQD